MRDEDVGPIPIVESQENRRLVGIVTDRDLAIKVIAEGRDSKATKVQDVMSSDVVTVGPDDDIRRAFDAMQKNQLRRIPVVENGKIVGIIAQADIATRLEAPKETAKVVENISRP
jgi:CBS domain-containing protein